MNFANKIVGNMIGRPVGPKFGRPNMTNKQFRNADFDGDGVPNWKDCRPFDRNRDMVRYVYFEATRDTGEKDLLYFGSKKAVRRYGEDNKINYVRIRELPYSEAKEKIEDQRLSDTRKYSKSVYSSTGKKKVEVPDLINK